MLAALSLKLVAAMLIASPALAPALPEVPWGQTPDAVPPYLQPAAQARDARFAQDRHAAQTALHEAETGALGTVYPWRDPGTGDRGNAAAIATRAAGCRITRSLIVLKPLDGQVWTQACPTPSRSWTVTILSAERMKPADMQANPTTARPR